MTDVHGLMPAIDDLQRKHAAARATFGETFAEWESGTVYHGPSVIWYDAIYEAWPILRAALIEHEGTWADYPAPDGWPDHRRDCEDDERVERAVKA